MFFKTLMDITAKYATMKEKAVYRDDKIKKAKLTVRLKTVLIKDNALKVIVL